MSSNEISEPNFNRIFYLDCLRALAIIGVILCHVSAPFVINLSMINSIEWDVALFFNCFRDFSVPLFVMISGALLINKNYGLIDFIKRKFIRIFVPFLFWDITYIFFVIFSFLIGISIYNTNPITFDLIYKLTLGFNDYNMYLWFVWMILTVYVVSFAINKIIEKTNIKVVDILLICFLIYSAYVSLYNFTPSSKLLYYLSFVGYGLLGYKLRVTDFPKSKIANLLRINKKRILIGSLIIGIILFLTIAYIQKSNALTTNRYAAISYFHIITVSLTSCIFLFFRYFEEYDGNIVKSIYIKIKEGIIGNLINSLSKCSYGIYLCHYIFIDFFILYLFAFLGFEKIHLHNPIKWIPFITFMVLVSSWMLIYLMSKVSYLKKVSGSG